MGWRVVSRMMTRSAVPCSRHRLAHLTPGNVELAGKIFGGILRDLAAGKDGEAIVMNVRARVATVPKAPAGGGASGKSRRLTPPGKRKSA